MSRVLDAGDGTRPPRPTGKAVGAPPLRGVRFAHWWVAFVWVLGLLLLALGCNDNLPKATAITHMRILGSQVQVVGDETRATPKPGEQAHVSFLTVFPSQKGTTAKSKTMLISCTAPARFTGGVPVCQEFLDVVSGSGPIDLSAALPLAARRFRCKDLPSSLVHYGSVSVQCIDGDPSADIDVPADFSAANMLLLGVVCERGEAYIDPTDPQIFGCENNSGETIRINAQIPVQHKAADENHNPDIAALTTCFDGCVDGSMWLAPPRPLPADDDCFMDTATGHKTTESHTLPSRLPGDHEVDLRYDGDKRERLPDKSYEDLELTVYTTLGSMERRFTLWSGAGDAGTPMGTGQSTQFDSPVEWHGPAVTDKLPVKGKLVRFFITMRDHRGGFAAATRAVCVYLPASTTQ